MKEQTEKQALEDFEAYMKEAQAGYDGVMRPRITEWSIPRIHFARMVWMNCRGFWL